MTADITAIARRAIELAGKATPGLWCEERLRRLLRYGRKNTGGWDEEDCGHEGVNPCELPCDGEDEPFIAFAREALPKLAEAYLTLVEEYWKLADDREFALRRAVRKTYEEARAQAAGIADEYNREPGDWQMEDVISAIRAMEEKP